MKDQSTEGTAIAVIFLGVGFYLALSWFAKLIGVDVDTAGSVAVRLMISGIIVGLWITWGESDFALDWPFYLCMVWVSFWPALDYWALLSGPVPPDIFGDDYVLPAQTRWWNAWYTTYGAAASLIGIGLNQRSKYR